MPCVALSLRAYLARTSVVFCFFHSCNHLFVGFASSAQGKLLSWQHLSLRIIETVTGANSAKGFQLPGNVCASFTRYGILSVNHYKEKLMKRVCYRQLVFVKIHNKSFGRICPQLLRHMLPSLRGHEWRPTFELVSHLHGSLEGYEHVFIEGKKRQQRNISPRDILQRDL